MRIKWLILGSVLTLLSNASMLIPEAVTSQSDVAQSIPAETIDGMPVHRYEGCFSSIPSDIDALKNEADLIVIGQIEQSLDEAEPLIGRAFDGQISSFASFSNMHVTKVFKGDTNLKNQSIKVGQSLVIVNDNPRKPYIQALLDVYPFQKSGKYLLFLKRAVSVEGYSPLGTFFGRYNLDGTDTSEERIDSPEYQALRKLIREQFPEE
jgi:hypothetical protein